MGFQPEYGRRLVREYSCEAEILYYRLATLGSKPNTVKTATKDSKVIVGVSVPSLESFQSIPEGGKIKRKGYGKGEYPDILHTGVGYVELGAKVEAWSLVTADDEGKAIPATKIDFDNRQSVAGTILDPGEKGSIVRIDLDRR
jgi:hypothetical protein